ncbi:SDR family oxidoreductase [Pelagicoccus sp. SDUM812002]|uniref:SDR family oxidoreductase n=1 Tax=Pelagicoccus sp. SDUM812002 TaxID=3041266 RepID=UPI00281065C1|nr:SDR family oxidoreductase [Pelagicoccus sp. SDUM812002]MDQ8186212.1 SDR family oxidoreductase [Pelagicoccus sp. SDUM812002]
MQTQDSPIPDDPNKKYSRPEFSTPKQDAPGTEEMMQPKADHGEQSYRGCDKLVDRVALITGADSGIGRAVALAYAREGADVAFTYLEEEADAKETERLIVESGRKALPLRSDQSDRENCEAVIEQVIEHFGRIDILVNNAAFQRTYSSLKDIPEDELRHVFKTNIESFFYLSRSALGQMRYGSSIINTTSIQAFSPSASLAPYAATKAAIANFTLSLAQEAIEKGVRVNAVAPGPVWTPLIPATMPKEAVESFGKNTLFGRPAQPAELAPVYVFLASEDSSYVTSEIYGVTGGRKQL